MMQFVELCEQPKIRLLLIARGSCGRLEVENRRPLGAQWRPLKVSWQVAIAPIGSTTLRIANFRQDDKAWQILIYRSQATSPSVQA